MARRPFTLEEVVEVLSGSLTDAIQKTEPQLKYDQIAAEKYAKEKLGIDLKKINDLVSGDDPISEKAYDQIVSAFKQVLQKNPGLRSFARESAREIQSEAGYSKGSVDQALQTISGKSTKVSSSPIKTSEKEIKELRDIFIKTLAKMGVRGKTDAVDRFLKDKVKKGTLRGTLTKEESKFKKGEFNEVIVKDLVSLFIASELRKIAGIGRVTTSRRVNPEQNAKEVEAAKAIQSALGKLGFPSIKEKSGGRITREFKDVRAISLKDPATASFLVSLLFFDDKGKPRKNLASFTGDWGAIVRAVADTGRGTPLERLQSALDPKTKEGQALIRVLGRNADNLIPGGPFFSIKRQGEGFDFSQLLSTYKDPAKFVGSLIASITGLDAKDIGKTAREVRDTTIAADQEKARRKNLRDDKRRARAQKTQDATKLQEAVSAAIKDAATAAISKKLKAGKITPVAFIRSSLSELDGIVKKLKETDPSGDNRYTGVERENLVAKARKIESQIRTVTGIFEGFAKIEGLTPKLKRQIKAAGFDVGVKDSLSKRIESKVSQATNRETGSTRLSTKNLTDIEQAIATALSDAKVSSGTVKTIMANLNTPGRIYELKGDELDDVLEAARLAEAGLRNAREAILASLETKALKGRAKAELRKALERATGKRGHGEYASPGSKKTGVNALHNNLALIVSNYIKHAQEVFAGATVEQRGQMVLAFAASMYQFQELERRIIARHLGRDLSTIRGSTLDGHALLPGMTMNSMDPKTGTTVKTSLIRLTGRLTDRPDSGGSRAYTEYMYLSGLLAGEINTSPVSSGANFFRTILGVADPGEQQAELKKITDQAAASLEERKAKKTQEKSAREKEALETIRKILTGDRAAFSDPAEMLKLVSYVSSARGGKLTATNFIQSLLQKASDQGKLNASKADLSKLAGLFKMGADGQIVGPGTKALVGAGGLPLAQLADNLRKALDPKAGDTSEIGKALGETLRTSFLQGGELFKKVATKGLEKDLTRAADETGKKLEAAQAARAKREERAAAGPRMRTTRAKLGELTRDEATGAFVDSKGLPLGFKDRGFKAQGIPPAGQGGLANYLVKQGLIEKPEDLVMSKGGRGAKPLIDLSASKFVSETAKEIAGIVQDVRAKAMKIDPTTGGKLAAAAAGSLTDLVKGKGFEKGATGKKAREAFNAAVDAAMQDSTVKRSFTKGGVKQEQTAPEFLKALQDQAAASGKVLTPRAARSKFLKTFKGDAATAVASRLGVDVSAGGDAGRAIVGKLSQQQQNAADAKAAARTIADLKKQVLARQTKLGRMVAGPGMAGKPREQYAQAMPFQQRMAAYDRAGLRGASVAAAGGAAPTASMGGQGMQFVPGATIAIPQVDIGPLKELASQMAEVGKSLALIPKATIPKGMSASLKEIASLMQVLATVKSPPSGANVSGFKKLIQDLNSLAASFGGKAPNTKNVGNIIAALRSVNKILDALSGIGTKTPANTLLTNMKDFRKSLSFIPKMFSSLGSMDFAGISNIGATIASTKFPSQQRLAGINEALLMIKQILETANGMKGGRMPTVTGGAVGGGGALGRARSRVYARQEALAQRVQGPGFGRYGRNDRFGARSIDAVRAMPLTRRMDYYDQIRTAAAGGGQRPPRERPARTGGGGGGNRFGGRDRGYSAPAGQFGVPRQIGGPMGPQISTGGVQQFANDSMGILGNLSQQIRFGFTQEITREIAQSFGRVIAHLKDGIIKFNSTLETATVAFQTLFENEQKSEGMEVNFKKAKYEAEGLVEALKKFANMTPFRFPQLAESARRMRAFGFETAEILPNMQAIGDAVAALGGEDDKIFRITYALGQMRQAGRVYQNDMMQLANAGIAGYDILSKALLQDFVKLGQMSLKYNGKIINDETIQTEEGYNDLVAAINAATKDATRGQVQIAESSSSEISAIFKRVSEDPIEAIRDLTQSGQIAGGAASSAIIEGLGQEYGGGMRKLSKTFEGAFSTLADVTQAFVADITRPVFESIRDEMVKLGTFLQSMFVANLVAKIASGFGKIVKPVQEVIGSVYKAISSVLTGVIELFGEVTGAFSLLETKTVEFVSAVVPGTREVSDIINDLAGDYGKVEKTVKQVTYTFNKSKGAGQEFITRIGSGIKMVADLLQFKLAKGIIGAAIGFKILTTAWNMNPLLLTLTAVTVGLTYLRDFLSTDIGKPFAASLSGAAASLSALARNFKQQILPILEKVMLGIGADFVGGLVLSISLMIPVLKQVLILLNTMLELMNAIPFLPTLMGMAIGLSLLRKMAMPLKNLVMGVPATMDARGNPIAATKGILGTLESAVTRITAKLLPMTTLVNRAPTEALRRLTPQVPAGTLGAPGRPSGFGAVAGGVEKILVQPAQKKMLSSQMLKQLLGSGVIKQAEYEAAMAARRAAMEAAARAGTGPGGISGLRELARTGGGTKAALGALGNVFADPTLNTTVRINSLVESIKAMFKAFRNLNLVIGSINKVKLAGNIITNFTKSLGLAARALPKAALSGISRLLKSFVLASALKFNSSIFSLVPKVFVPFMDVIKTTGVSGTGGDLVGNVRRAAAAGMNRAGRLAISGGQVPFAMPNKGVTGGPIGYLVRAIRGLRPNRLPFEAPGQAAASVGQRVGPINRIIEAVVRRTATQVPVGTLGAPGGRSGFGAIAGAIEKVFLRTSGGAAPAAQGLPRAQVLGGSPSMYGVSIFKVIQERIKYLTGKVADTAGLYAARITTAFEKSFMAFHRMMIRLAGAPARIFTMQNFDKIITRYAEGMVRAFTPKTAPIAGFLAGGTKKAPTELFAGLKDAIARRVIPNTLVGAPGPTFTDKIFAGADKLAKVSERFAEMMVKGFAPRTVPIEKFLAGGTARAPKEMFAGLKDAIARIVIPDKFTQPISLFQRAVMFFKNAASGFGAAVKGLAASTAGAGGNLLSKFGTSIVGGGGALLAAMRASKGMALASSSIKVVGSGIMGAVNKIGKFNLLLSTLLAGNTIRERIGAEGEKNAGAIIGQEGAGLAGALIGGKVIGGAVTARIGTAVGALGGPIGMVIGTVVGQVIGSFLGGLVFPGQEVTPAEQEQEEKAKRVAEYMTTGGMEAQEFVQLLTDFDFTPVELLDMSVDYYGSVDSVFERIKNGVATIMPALSDSLQHMLQGLGDSVNVEKDGTTALKQANKIAEAIREKMASFYQELGRSPMEAMVLAQAEISKAIADMGQVKTIEEAQSALAALARNWGVNPDVIDGFNLFIGGTNSGLEKLQTNLEKVRSEFQKLASRLQSRINAVFEQQMTKALEKAKDAFLATQKVIVDGTETNILALREEIEATEKRNKLLAIEKKLRDAARSVEMAKLGQYDASMDPLEAASRMREAQEAQTEAVKEAALERKKIALEEAMASDPVVAGLEDVDERFEAARMKFQEGMEDILELVEAGKLTGTQAAAKIKELYTTTLGEVGVLDANLDVDAQNFGDSFLGTWDTILKKFEAIVTRLKKAIAAVNSYKPGGSNDPSVTPPSATSGLPNSDSVLGGKAYDNWRGHGIPFSAQMIKDAILMRTGLLLQVLKQESQNNMNGLIYTDGPRQMGYSVALSKAMTSMTTPSGLMYKKIEAAKNDKNGMEMMTSALQIHMKPLFKYFEPQSGKMLDLKYPLANMASGGTIMGEGGMFQVGEAGRETLQVVPGGVARVFPRRIRPISQIGMAGSSGGGINASVIINNPTVRSDQDIRKLADAVGKAQSSLLRSAGIGRI